MPQVRGDAPRVRGARRGRVAGAGPRVLRPRPLAQGHGPARVPRARGGRLGGPRRARVRGRDARGARGGLRGVPGHVPARAHGALRGRGPRPCAAREGTAVSCQAGGTRPDESLTGRRPGSAAGMPREPRRSAATCASAACRTPRCAWSAGGDLGDELCEVADRGRPTDEAHGLGPGGRGRGSVRHGRRPPGPRPGAPGACVSRHDATPAREAVRGELGMADAMHARPEGFLARLGGSRR